MPRTRKQSTASIAAVIEAPMPIKKESGSIELRVTRTLVARPEDIFDLWLDWKSAGSPWFGAAKAIVHPVVDGLFYHCVRFQGDEWPHYGRFITLIRPSLIRHSWVSEATRGMESIVSLTIEPEGDRTRITLVHSNLPDDEMGRRHEEGWGFVVQMLVDHLRRK